MYFILKYFSQSYTEFNTEFHRGLVKFLACFLGKKSPLPPLKGGLLPRLEIVYKKNRFIALKNYINIYYFYSNEIYFNHLKGGLLPRKVYKKVYYINNIFTSLKFTLTA